jgi:hypothetical protein
MEVTAGVGGVSVAAAVKGDNTVVFRKSCSNSVK